MHYSPSRGFMVGWTTDLQEAVAEVAARAAKGLRASLHHFPDTIRGEGPVWMVRWPYTARAKGTNPRAKGTNPRAETAEAPDPRFFDDLPATVAHVE